MAPINSDSWKKSASFESLSTTVQGQMDVHNESDLMTIISREMPIDVTAAHMESTRVKNKVITSMTM